MSIVKKHENNLRAHKVSIRLIGDSADEHDVFAEEIGYSPNWENGQCWVWYRLKSMERNFDELLSDYKNMEKQFKDLKDEKDLLVKTLKRVVQ
jgi:hypothetical protein